MGGVVSSSGAQQRGTSGRLGLQAQRRHRCGRGNSARDHQGWNDQEISERKATIYWRSLRGEPARDCSRLETEFSASTIPTPSPSHTSRLNICSSELCLIEPRATSCGIYVVNSWPVEAGLSSERRLREKPPRKSLRLLSEASL